MNRLANRTAIITGGSSGIGLATAQRVVDEGAYVFMTLSAVLFPDAEGIHFSPERWLGANLSECAAKSWRSLTSGAAGASNVLCLPGMDVMCIEGLLPA